MLILIVFGSSGVGIVKCSCSGKISMANPVSHKCCPTESDCMTVTVVHFSTGEMQHCVDIPHLYPMMLSLDYDNSELLQSIYSPTCNKPYFQSSPPGHIDKTVLRV